MLTLLITLIGVMAGIYFAFSVFVMKALGELPGTAGAKAMNRINDVIVNTLFLPLFMGTSVWAIGLIFWSLGNWQAGGYSSLMVTAALMYAVGMFGVTAFGNVPLNNRLKASVEADHEQDLIHTWRDYQIRWTRLNHIRTLSCIGACALLAMAIGWA